MQRVHGLKSVQAELDADAAWRLLRCASSSTASTALGGAGFARRGPEWVSVPPEGAEVLFDVRFARAWHAHIPVNVAARELLDIHGPLCAGPRARTLVVGHLGQSLDGRIATRTGSSQFITGTEDVTHTHRLRALFDAVVVGARTVIHDDPRLTTRLVAGEHPTRVILDPMARLCADRSVFRDGLAPTLLLVSEQAACTSHASGEAEIVQAPSRDGRFVLPALMRILRERGLMRIFVEGGGVTVSRFLSEGLFDRLHVTVAPVILGSGVPALDLPPIDLLSQAMRVPARHFSLGCDVLFDCDLSAQGARKDQ